MSFKRIKIQYLRIFQDKILRPDYMIFKEHSHTVGCSEGSSDYYYGHYVIDDYGIHHLDILDWQELELSDGRIIDTYSIGFDKLGLFVDEYDSESKQISPENRDYLLLNSGTQLQKAMYYASISSLHIWDNGGQLIQHLIRVMEKCKNEEEKIIALLHQLNISWIRTNENNLRSDFGDSLYNKIYEIQEYRFYDDDYCLSDLINYKDEYIEYLTKIKNDASLLKVKMADLEEGMAFRREFNRWCGHDNLDKIQLFD